MVAAAQTTLPPTTASRSRDAAKIGFREGVDGVLIETMSDSYEIKAAVLGVKEACSLPVFVTMVFDEKGKLLTGGTVESMTAMLEGLGVDGIGVNCGLGPVQMKPIVEQLLKVTSLPVIVNPNAGLPRSEGGRTVYDIDSDTFAEEMADIAAMGAVVVRRMLRNYAGPYPENGFPLQNHSSTVAGR